jgi:hypothetical protein
MAFHYLLQNVLLNIIDWLWRDNRHPFDQCSDPDKRLGCFNTHSR